MTSLSALNRTGVRPCGAWYAFCFSEELGAAPKVVVFFGLPVVLFRDAEGLPVALLDRCAHRNVPLSLGRVVGSEIECGYHGWRFDGRGVCRHVPALCAAQEGRGRRVPAFFVREAQGIVWVWDPGADAIGKEHEQPSEAPFQIPHWDDSGYAKVTYATTLEAGVHATAENILDVPHTAFLHRGLFRTDKRHAITAIVRRGSREVEVEYVGEPRPAGVLGRLLAPKGGAVKHFDRFYLPGIAQVDYALGNSHLVINNMLTPLSHQQTLMHTVVTLKLPVGSFVLSKVLRPLAMKVLQQDADMLQAQSENIQRFGGERFVSTAVDLLGPHIQRLLKQAEQGDIDEDKAVVEERIEMLA